MDLDKIFLAVLQMVGGLGGIQLAKLISYFGSAKAVWEASDEDVYLSKCVDYPVAERLCCSRKKQEPEQLAEEWRKKNIKLCSIEDEMYPALLKQIFNPPMLLFYRGILYQDAQNIAIVGARKFSPYGRSVAEALGAELAANGVTVISGAARGIDTAAHTGALRTGKTVAVLGCGIDVVYPSENRKLLEDIAKKGAVTSEYGPGTRRVAGFFAARNRIISGIASGTVVIEAAEKSGSLITAEMALSEGRDVFAVPGSIYSEQSKGCHKSIQQGAKLVCKAADVLEEYRWQEKKTVEISKKELSSEEIAVYEVLSFEKPLPIDEIICKLRCTTTNIAFILLQMELRGIVREDASHCYVRVVKEGIL
ncbi:MAG: DNA-processing protein DprA [Selenomonadaceae bacterium]